MKVMRKRLPDYDKLLTGQPIWRKRLEDVGYLPLDGLPRARRHRPDPALRRACRGTCARSSRTAATRSTTSTSRPRHDADCYGRFRVRVHEMHESLKIVEQAVDRLRARAR